MSFGFVNFCVHRKYFFDIVAVFLKTDVKYFSNCIPHKGACGVEVIACSPLEPNVMALFSAPLLQLILA